MKIGVIGSGKIGLSVGKLWAVKGHRILFSDAAPELAKTAAESMKGASDGSAADAVKFGEVVLLSIPYSSLNNVLEQITSDSSAAKIIIDCTNPLSSDYRSLLLGHTTSAAEEIAKRLPSAKFNVVKALNMIASPVLESGDTTFGDDKATMFYCGDDAEAKRTMAQLIEDLGFEPVDAGPLVNARFLEPLAALIIQLALSQEMGTNIALKLLRR